MHRTKRFFYNSLAAAFYQMVLIITGLITPRIMLKFYGSEINGLISSINQFIVYFNLVEAGLSTAAIYALYKPLADNDYKEISGVVTAAKKFYFQVGYIFVSLIIGLSVIYPLFVETSLLSPLNVSLLVLILGVNGVLEFFTLAKYRAILTADQRNYVVSLASIVHLIVNMLIIAFLANQQVNVVIIYFVAIFSIFLRSIILILYVRLKYSYINYKEKPNTDALSGRWDALYLQILGAIQVGAPIIILTIVTKDLLLVSIYSVFSLVTNGLRGLLNIFKSGISASFGNIIAKDELSILQNSYQEFETAFYFALTIIYSVAFITIMPFIRVYTNGINDVNYDIPIVGYLLVIDGVLYSIKNPQGTLVLSAGLFKETRLQATVQGLIILLIGTILTVKFGLIGVLLGSILSNLYRTVDLLIFVPRKITHLPIKDGFYRVLRVLISISVIIMPFFFIEVTANNFITWTILAAVISIYAFLITTIIWLKFDRNLLLNVLNRFRHMF